MKFTNIDKIGIGVAIFAALFLLTMVTSSDVGSMLALGAVLAAGYFFPSIIAGVRGHPQTLAIFLLNMLLGWTFIGWVASLVWAATAINNKVSA